MPEASDRDETFDPIVYGVRPEPPLFEELVRRPDPVEPYAFALYPPGPVRRWVGARRARIAFRIFLAVALVVVLAIVTR